ncbi:MAG: hypothetical protein H0T42_01505 [Deltaproteobacteria bacterium]|nr:hypothetical protein [Deltaproteobacteria bacterium]
MRSLIALVLMSAAVLGCDGGGAAQMPEPPCSDGEDNDADGMVDFPDDLGCTSTTDDTEDSLPSAQCQDGRDNDGDGLKDYPSDPGCFAPQADDETDDCPTGPNCPQCADEEDNDGNGSIDYPDDPGCTAAADDDEFLHNPVACGTGLMILPLPPTGMVMGTLDTTSTSMVMSPCGGGGGAPAIAYELHLSSPRVVEVSTDDAVTTADTVIDIRSDQCSSVDAHLACSDDISTSNSNSKVTKSLQAGNYYVIVGAHDSGSAGAFALQVKTFAGEGTTCTSEGDCGPGLVCRIPKNQTAMICSNPRCDDMDDEDGDGKLGYPTDPGCTSPADNDEADTCTTTPGAAGCPECGDLLDNDTDTKIDYPMDLTCKAAGDASEACVTSEGVQLITSAMTMGDTTGATNDVTPMGCSSTFSHTAGDRTFRIDVPMLTSLDMNLTASFDTSSVLYNSLCTGAPIKCSDPLNMNVLNLAAGTYYFVVDGYSTGMGPFTINMNGKIANNQSCESPLVAGGALSCGNGYACKGTAGSKTCAPALCSDGLDNDSPADGKADYPADPGCDSPADDTEVDLCPGGAGCPICANGVDNDADSLIDWPADYGCVAASGTTEVFCMPETDPTSLITTTQVMGTTAGGTNGLTPACSTFSTAPEKVYALSLPVPVQTLTLNTNPPVGMTSFDTVLHVKDAACTAATSFGCDDDNGDGTQSLVTMTNVAPGNYAIVVDGYSSNAGMYWLNVSGVVATGTACTSSLFSGGAAAVLKCTAPNTCTGGICQ